MYVCAESLSPLDYVPGRERPSLYKEIWRRYSAEFLACYDEVFAGRYGPLPLTKRVEIEKLLRCGRFDQGFHLYECEHCKTKLVLPFSCKSRLCLSCYRRKLFGWSVNLSSILDPSLSHRHMTFTIPGRLRNILWKRGFMPDRLTTLAATFHSRAMMQKKQLDHRLWKPGILATMHRCGNSLNFNPHDAHAQASRSARWCDPAPGTERSALLLRSGTPGRSRRL